MNKKESDNKSQEQDDFSLELKKMDDMFLEIKELYFKAYKMGKKIEEMERKEFAKFHAFLRGANTKILNANTLLEENDDTEFLFYQLAMSQRNNLIGMKEEDAFSKESAKLNSVKSLIEAISKLSFSKNKREFVIFGILVNSYNSILETFNLEIRDPFRKLTDNQIQELKININSNWFDLRHIIKVFNSDLVEEIDFESE